MSWQDELEKKSLFGAALYARKVVKVKDVIIIITSLLKKQRESCADAFFGKDKTGGSYHRRIKHNIRNAPEPE